MSARFIIGRDSSSDDLLAGNLVHDVTGDDGGIPAICRQQSGGGKAIDPPGNTLRYLVNPHHGVGRKEAGISTGVVLLIIMASSVVGWIVTYEQLPAAFTLYAKETLREPWLIILAMNLIMLAVAMFIDLPAAVLLLTPMFVPLGAAVGMDTIQRGIMMIVNLSIGLYHPPIGTTLFITSTIAKVRIGDVVAELIPFYFVAIGLLLAFAYLPWLTLR